MHHVICISFTFDILYLHGAWYTGRCNEVYVIFSHCLVSASPSHSYRVPRHEVCWIFVSGNVFRNEVIRLESKTSSLNAQWWPGFLPYAEKRHVISDDCELRFSLRDQSARRPILHPELRVQFDYSGFQRLRENGLQRQLHGCLGSVC